MKAQLVMQLEPRQKGHSAVLKALHDGKVPGVLYGSDATSTPVQVPLVVLRTAVGEGGEHHPFMAQFQGQNAMVVIRDLQRDTFTNAPVHFDLMPVSADVVMTVDVPIQIHGEHELNSRGLFLHVDLHSVSLHGKLGEMPEAIQLEIGALKAGAAITVGDLKLPPGVTAHEKPTVAVLHVAHSRVRATETTV